MAEYQSKTTLTYLDSIPLSSNINEPSLTLTESVCSRVVPPLGDINRAEYCPGSHLGIFLGELSRYPWSIIADGFAPAQSSIELLSSDTCVWSPPVELCLGQFPLAKQLMEGLGRHWWKTNAEGTSYKIFSGPRKLSLLLSFSYNASILKILGKTSDIIVDRRLPPIPTPWHLLTPRRRPLAWETEISWIRSTS